MQCKHNKGVNKNKHLFTFNLSFKFAKFCRISVQCEPQTPSLLTITIPNNKFNLIEALILSAIKTN